MTNITETSICEGECGIGSANITITCLQQEENDDNEDDNREIFEVNLSYCNISQEYERRKPCQLPNPCLQGMKENLLRITFKYLWVNATI